MKITHWNRGQKNGSHFKATRGEVKFREKNDKIPVSCTM